MALPTFTPPIPPSLGLKRRPEVKLLKVDFGEGYTQISRDGTNHIRQVVELQWDFLAAVQINEMIAFFEERGGDLPFYYRLPVEPTARKWRCEEWESTATTLPIHGSFRAVFREDFSLET